MTAAAGAGTPAMREYLPQRSLWRILGVLGFVIAPHFMRLPVWESAVVVGLCLWRLFASLRQWRMPNTWLKAALTIGAFAGVYFSYGRVSGQHPGIALLVIMLALKLTELRARRDVMVTVFILYFLLVTHFLYSQELWTIAYLLISAGAITAVLVDVNHANEPLPARVALRLGGVMVAQALPVMLLLFVLFPRVPGPLWGLPSDSGAARSGLSDSMSPGDISQLAQSDEIAFRVRFFGPVPPPQQRYWRGPVFPFFDGRTWAGGFRGTRDFEPPPVELSGPFYDYEVTLEPTRTHWLFALELPRGRDLPPLTRLNADYQLVHRDTVRERLQYRLASQPSYRLQPELPAWLANTTRRLPQGYNPRAVELAQGWRAAAQRDEDVIAAALRLFHEQAFVYTLEPPALGRDSIDEFLFETRRGFCEHYAGSFTFLMRAAGLHARVVTGYQGGEKNAFGDYYVVRQSDAHAWSEVWIAGRGWMRVDPTAAVAPNRVERGAGAALGLAAGADDYLQGRLSWTAVKYMIEARWDWINARWNGMVLAYGTELQREFLSRFGLDDWSRMVLALTFGLTGTLAVLGLVLMRRSSAPPVTDRALRLWRRAVKRLARGGLEQLPGEGPRDYVERVCRSRPELAAPLQAVLGPYLQLRYLGAADAAVERELAQAIRRLPR